MKTPTKEPIVIFVIWFSFFNIPNTSLITILFTNLPECRGYLPCLVGLWLIRDMQPQLHFLLCLYIKAAPQRPPARKAQYFFRKRHNTPITDCIIQ